MDLLCSLDDPQLNLATAGGKGHQLGQMRRAGLPVPAGLVLTTAAYRAFVKENGLWPAIAAAAALPDTARAAEQIAAAFAAAPIPAAIRAAIEAQCPKGPVAVRSSATAEDLPDASFAGQQDTYLHITGPPAIAAAVVRCWASLWTARAQSYRRQRGIDPAEVALAVVIQEMAPAEVAGVLFTVHPTSGRADRMVVNATWGLGEALVSGKVNPDSYVIAADTGRPLRVDLGDKQVMTAPDATGTAEVAVPADRQKARALDDAALVALAAAGRRLAALFGCPQDVEWALVGGALVLLQSRPITTALGPPGDDDWDHSPAGPAHPFDFWTQQDMGERWPDPISPLTWSICAPMDGQILRGMMAGLKDPDPNQITWSRRAHGHVYMNEGALLHCYTHGFGMPMSMMGSGLTHPDARPKDAEGWRLGRVLSHLPFYYKAAAGWEKEAAAFSAQLPAIDALVDDFMAKRADWEPRPDADLYRAARVDWMGHLLHHVTGHTRATSLAMGAYTELEQLLGRLTGDPSLVQVLTGGISGVTAAEMGDELAALAEALRAAGLGPTVCELPPAAAWEALQADPRAAAFHARLPAFLSRHGHRCPSEAELRHPRWSEAPALLLAQLRPYLRGEAAGGQSAAAADRRVAETARLRTTLGWLSRASFDRALERAHRFTRLRDNGQSYIVKLLLPQRYLLATLGRRWAARGWLREADDLFFLLDAEVGAVAAAAAPLPDLQGRADARRAAHTHWCAQEAPYALDGNLEPAPLPLPAGGAFTLVGVAASRGSVTGRARLIAHPDAVGEIAPGDILVTRSTDPGWTPLFSRVAGVVVEIGGLLSHGAIVAREYGLPAVVGVSGATRRIAEGDTITVDGAAGRVHLPRPAASTGPATTP